MSHDFDVLINGTDHDDAPDRRVFQFPPEWGQGRATFGGIVSAAALFAMRQQISPERLPRSVMTSFVGPVSHDPADIRVQTLREGRSLTQMHAELVQDEQVRTTLQASFGAPRPSSIAISPEALGEPPAPDTLMEMPYIAGITPAFTQFFRYRWTSTDYPYTGSDTAKITGWCKHKTAATEPYTAVLGMLDAWPSPVLSMLTSPAPASTVHWTVYFNDMPEQMDDGWWFFRAEASHAQAGYVTMHNHIYRPDGKLAAQATQLVAVFG
ncbi:MAG: thioesterase family protein [Myxococcota bacterium]